MSSTSSLSEILTNTNSTNRTIGLNKITKTNSNKPQTKANTQGQQRSILIDTLLEDYKDLIDPAYKMWFCKKFWTIGYDMIHRAASEARQEGKDPRRLFAYKISQYSMAQ